MNLPKTNTQPIQSFQNGPIKATGLKISRRSDKTWCGWEQQSPSLHLPGALQLEKRAPDCNRNSVFRCLLSFASTTAVAGSPGFIAGDTPVIFLLRNCCRLLGNHWEKVETSISPKHPNPKSSLTANTPSPTCWGHPQRQAKVPSWDVKGSGDKRSPRGQDSPRGQVSPYSHGSPHGCD